MFLTAPPPGIILKHLRAIKSVENFNDVLDQRTSLNVILVSLGFFQ